MIERLDSYESGVIDLATLADDLRGLMAASELRDEHLVDGFWDHFREIDMVLELRNEPWAPVGIRRVRRQTSRGARRAPGMGVGCPRRRG
jgi:hypothetical protein